MAYRDDLDAARLRAETLAQEVEHLTAERAADEGAAKVLRERLGKAERELVRLQGQIVETPPKSMRVWNVVLALGAISVLATVVAGAQSERDGVSVSYLAGAILGAGFGGRRRGVAGAILGAIVVLLLLAAFYAGVWPSL